MSNYGNIFLQTLTNAIQQSGYQKSISSIINAQGLSGNNPNRNFDNVSNIENLWDDSSGGGGVFSLRRPVTCGETECGSDDIVS